MDKDVLSIVVIVLELIGAVLLCALLATPAPKHAIVKAFVVTTLAHSIATVIPSIAFQVIPDNLDALQDHPMIQAFCAADAIIFTLPLLYLSCKFRWFLKASWSLGDPKTLRLDDMPSLARTDTHMADRPASATIIPRHILLRPMLQQQISSVPSVRERVSLDPLGLSPPPRHLGSQCTSPTETIVRQTLVTMPSLTAFGGRSSYSELSMSSEMRRDGQPNSSGELSSRPSTADTCENVGIDDGSWISYPAYPC